MRKPLKHWFSTRVIKNYPKQFMSGGTNVVQDTSYLKPHLSFLSESDMPPPGENPCKQSNACNCIFSTEYGEPGQ